MTKTISGLPPEREQPPREGIESVEKEERCDRGERSVHSAPLELSTSIADEVLNPSSHTHCIQDHPEHDDLR